MNPPLSPADEISKLVEYVEDNFPKGCIDIATCSNCPLHDFDNGSMKLDTCEMLSAIEYRTR